MALTDALVNASEYRRRVKQSDTTDDSDLRAQLKAVSRYVERRVSRAFTKTATGVQRKFVGSGRAEMWIDDLLSVSAVSIDEDYDGTFSRSVTTSNVLLAPYNAAERSEPFTRLVLAPYTSNTEINIWTRGSGSIETVRVTAQWGWSTPPPDVKEAVIIITRHIRDLARGGAALSDQMINQEIQQTARLPKIIDELVKTYARVVMEFV